MGRAHSKITKEMGIYEAAAYQAASIPTTQIDPDQMRALLAEATKPPVAPKPVHNAPRVWLQLAIALAPALAYLVFHYA